MAVIMSLRVAKTKTKTKSFSLGIPSSMGHQLEKAGTTVFILELTSDGILFRPTEAMAPDSSDLPEWLQTEEADEKKKS